MSTELHSNARWLMLAAMAIAVFIAPAAEATPIRYNFTVDVTSGPLSGTSSSGSFSYNSDSITPGALNVGMWLFTAIHYTFNGITYNAASANSGDMLFDAAGNLRWFAFGTDCQPGVCSVGLTYIDTEWYVANSGSQYTLPHYPGQSLNEYYGMGNVAFAVPEPAVLGMFGLGVLLIGLFSGLRRRIA